MIRALFKNWKVFLGAVGLVGLGVPLTLSLVPGVGAGEAAGGLQDPMALLAARSPGERPMGALWQVKDKKNTGQRIVRRATPPSYRVLTGARERPTPFATNGMVPLSPLEFANVEFGPPTALQNIPFGFPVSTTGPFGQGGGFIDTGQTLTPISPPPGGAPGVPVTSVPELTTWAQLVIGFGLIGAALRRRLYVRRVALSTFT